jgi:uncharacterized RDD family membrane protein YckC
VNQRLAAHRNKRGGTQEDARGPAAESPRAASARAAEAAARVAARYAKAPSYNQLLAGEARAVVRAAGAAAEAARNAQAAAQAVLAGLESGPMSADGWEHPVSAPAAAPSAAAPSRWQDEPPAVGAAPASPARQETPWAGAQPRWEETLPGVNQGGERDVWSEMRVHPAPYSQEPGPRGGERYVADEGELFPEAYFDVADPMQSATVEPVQHLPANLIEFPRELVAARKARPRLAEGPLYEASQENPQLSIFEVDPQLLAPPVYLHAAAVAPPGWASIELEHPDDVAESGYAEAPEVYAAATEIPVPYAAHRSALAEMAEMQDTAVEEAPAESHVIRESGPAAQAWVSLPSAVEAPVSELLVARMSDRLLAAVVDGALVTLAFLAAAVVVIASTAHPPTGRIALIASGLGLVLFGALYQFLFLSYAEEGTPGMRYARIALCTFNDDNPTVAQMRKRIPAQLLSVLPVGLGLVWAAFDGDHLGWHDRLTRTYQRKY